MHIAEFSEINRTRCTAVDGFNHPIELWTLSDWMTATAGELGEAANIIKKLNRLRDNLHNEETVHDLRRSLAKELADTYSYLDLLAQAAGVDLEAAVKSKFDEVSERVGYPLRLTGQ